MSYGSKMRVFSRNNGHCLFLIYFVLGASLLIGINAINITSEYAKTFKCKHFVIRTEDFTMSVNRRSDKGTHTPPIPAHRSAAGQPPTRIPVQVPVTYNQDAGVEAGAYDSCQETSSILSKANEVLYVTPDNIYPTQSMAVRTQFSAPQGKHQSVTTSSTITTACPFTTTSTGAYYGGPGAGPGPSGIVNPGVPNFMVGQAPIWLSQLSQNLESRLSHIDNQLSNQNSQWQNMDRTLQA